MGQYFIATFLDDTDRITRAVHPLDYGSGQKLAGHTREGTPFLAAVETLLALDGGARLVWAGDYASVEPGHDANLYWLIEPHQFVRFEGLIDPAAAIEPNTARPPAQLGFHTYVCNADRRQYFDKLNLPHDHDNQPRNMLPALTVESHSERGRWARDRIYITETQPDSAWTKVPSRLWA